MRRLNKDNRYDYAVELQHADSVAMVKTEEAEDAHASTGRFSNDMRPGNL
jgi:hypothetical protein